MQYNLQNIKEAVDMVTGLDISTISRQREFVYARALYYKIALDHTPATYQKITSLVNIKQHQTLLSLMSQFESILDYKNYRKLYESCLEVLGIDFIKEKIEPEFTEVQISVFNELKKLSDSQLLEFNETRLKPFISMLKNRIEAQEIKKVVGASLNREKICV